MRSAISFLSILAAMTTCAATRTWLLNIDGDWSTAAYWSDSTVPGSGDTADLSNLTGSKTLRIAANVSVGNIVYAPAVGSATNTLTLLSDTDGTSSRIMTIGTSMTVGQKANLVFDCYGCATGGVFYKYGRGRVTAKRPFYGSTAKRMLRLEKGEFVLDSGCTMYNILAYVGTATSDTDKTPAELIVEEGGTYDFTGANDVEFGQNSSNGTNALSVLTVNGGTMLPKNGDNGGVFIDGLGYNSSSILNLKAGLIDGFHASGKSSKTFWPTFRGTGVVNQTGGVMKWDSITTGGFEAQSVGIYNLLGGELWLAGNVSRYSSKGTVIFNYGDAKLVMCASGNIYSSPSTVTLKGTLHIDVTNSAYTATVPYSMTGTGGLVKEGPGTLFFSSSPSFSGPIVVSNGVLSAGGSSWQVGNNDVMVAGGTMSMNNGTYYLFNSVTVCGTGVMQIPPNVRFDVPRKQSYLTVKDSGQIKFLNGAALTGFDSLVLTNSAGIDMSSGGVACARRLVVDGVEMPEGTYTSNTCTFVTGGGTFFAGGITWKGAAGNDAWTSADNWDSGFTPYTNAAIVSLSAATNANHRITFDASVTNNSLVFNPGLGGTVLTNASPDGTDSTMSFTAGGVIYVGEGDTLVLDHKVCFLSDAQVYKRGPGTLVFAKKMYGSPTLTATFPQAKLVTEEGKTISEGGVVDMGIISGHYDESDAGPTPEFVFADTPDSGMFGKTILVGMNQYSTTKTPGNGLVTMNGGLVALSNSWDTAGAIGYALAGSALSGTGTFHIAGGTLRTAAGKAFVFAMNNGHGVLEQSGGTVEVPGRISEWSALASEAYLSGGVMRVGSFGSYAEYITFFLQGGTFEPYSASLSCPCPIVLSGNGSILSTPSGKTLTLTGVLSGDGGFTKTGEGTATIAARLSESNGVSLLAGTLALQSSCSFGTLGITNGTLQLTKVNTAGRFFLNGVEQPGNGAIYSSNNCANITGDGILVVGAQPGIWTGSMGDFAWSSETNWSANVIPNCSSLSVNLSAATNTDTLSFDAGNIAIRDLTYDTGASGSALTNRTPPEADNVLTIAADGIITVGEGQTLVLDHKVCFAGVSGTIVARKRGLGTLVLKRDVYPETFTPSSERIVAVEAGKVIAEGSITNMSFAAGKPDRSVAGPDPEFVLADTEQASILGATFVRVMSPDTSALTPGNGVFTQNGGILDSILSWNNYMIIGLCQAGGSLGGTGTYNLVNGTLRIAKTKYFSLSLNNGYGIFRQSGGLLEICGAIGSSPRGEIYLSGGTMRLNSISGSTPFYFSGGTIEPYATSLGIAVPFTFTGNGTFAVADGKTMTLYGGTSGTGDFTKTGAGTLVIGGNHGFTGGAYLTEGATTLSGSFLAASNVVLGATSTLNVQNGSKPFNTNLFLRCAKGGKINLNFSGTVEVGRLNLGGFERTGKGCRYGSKSHTSAVNKVDDNYFTGTGVLKVVGPSDGAGTVVLLK